MNVLPPGALLIPSRPVKMWQTRVGWFPTVSGCQLILSSEYKHTDRSHVKLALTVGTTELKRVCEE